MSLVADLECARRFVALRSPPGRVLQCGVTGSHFYGFPSPDSDVDLKGIHLAPTARVLGLDAPSESHDALEVFEGVEHDLTTHELARAMQLLLRGNGNVLERILTPIQLFQSAEQARLVELARACVSRRFSAHYRGFFGGMCREHARENRVKTLLYAYRVALTGIHLMRTGELCGDVTINARTYRIDGVDELVAIKRAGEEKGTLDEAISREHAPRLAELEAMLDLAIEESTLPEEPPGYADIDAFVIDTRMRAINTTSPTGT
jgi:uncharacterized protein